VPTRLGRGYRYPVAASVVTVVLVDQRNFFFFLFILVKHTASSLSIITTFSIDLGNGVHQAVTKE
jgi:hypothetical protein